LTEGSAARGLQGRIALPPIEDRFGYHLVGSLERRLGRPDEAAYRLAIRTTLEERGLAVAPDNSVTRVTIFVTANWALYRDGEPDPILQDEARSQSGYNTVASLFATRQARRDIERRLARDLGERIARAILARANRVET